MPLVKLSAAQLVGPKPARAPSEYETFLKNTKVNDGGIAMVAEEKGGRQTIKNRLNKAAKALGIQIKFLRSPAESVIFQVTGK